MYKDCVGFTWWRDIRNKDDISYIKIVQGLPGEELAGMKNVSIKTGTTTERMECASACATDKTGCSGLIFVYSFKVSSNQV